MKNYLISIGGNSTSNILSIESNFDEIIAVDSGVEHLFKLALDPNTLIGDLDSISENSLDKVKKNGVDIIAFNSNKDQTDFELALNYLEGVENSIIYIIGGESGEIDHLLSIFLLIPSKSFFENIIWVYGDKKIIFRQKLKLNVKKMSKFSIIPLSDLSNLSIDGAEWNLENKNIQFGETTTLRNVANKDEINVNCDTGVFAFIY
ncbi:MAG: thiamine pyrophosphokinase [Actinomycetota bacterium]|jgi:thiamine pyrophosphokinase|nr:MAG: thiamine pyrophosphokinase [Actinomycetota bacterium]